MNNLSLRGMNYFVNKSVLIISTEEWDHIPVSKHHYAYELANVGARVFFLNPPSAVKSVNVKQVEKNIHVIDYAKFRGVNSMPSFVRNFFNSILIRRFRRMLGHGWDVVWSFDPYRFQDLSQFGAKLRIYHTADLHTIGHELAIAQTADMVFSVSDLLLEKFNALPNQKLKINHGLTNHFINEVDIVSPTVKNVGYVGNLDRRSIDVDSLIKIVEENANLKFHFIGPYRKDSALANRLRQYSHCDLHGAVPSKELPKIFSELDIFLICYDGRDKIVNSNNHKILEFLSTGKPVVINYTDEYRDRTNLVAMANENDELPPLFKRVVTDFARYCSPDIVKERVRFAQSNTYKAHVERISEMVQRHRSN